MIRALTMRRFKRFDEVTFDLQGHVVLAGPNNLGKTTILQAIAAWSLALARWKQLGDFQRHGGQYPWAPIARQAFLPVPLVNFEWLWHERRYQGHVEIDLASDKGWRVGMQLRADSTEQIYVRPTANVEPDTARSAQIRCTYVPPMSGLSIGEPVYTRAKQDQLLGQGRPGEIIRNLLLEASQSAAWGPLTEAVRRLFGCELLVPDGSGPDIVCEYRAEGSPVQYEISATGSGMQQVVMLLSFMHMRPASVLLLDEPDAHLHVFLQDSIYNELRSVAARQDSQLIMATHSEVIINSVAPEELCLVYGHPRRLADVAERSRLAQSLRILNQADVTVALEAPGVLYLEGPTDLALLREWARILQHPVYQWLSQQPFWRPLVWEGRPGATGTKARDHFEALRLVRPDITGVLLLDSDGEARGATPSPSLEKGALNRLAWSRYETESYLVHPGALARFLGPHLGGEREARQRVIASLTRLFGASELAEAFAAVPHEPPPIVESFLVNTKAREAILPPILTDAGIHGMDYTRYADIAAAMARDDVHPEVLAKLDQIQQAFGL
ncbi:MAG: AAA family ATPase [Candidatus Latescibacterota bacterium]